MKFKTTKICIYFFLCLLIYSCNSKSKTEFETEGKRTKININKNWLYLENDTQTIESALRSSNWQKVDIPHSWNSTDATDITPGYRRSSGWYKKEIDITLKENTVYEIYFEGVNITSSVFMNGKKVGGHIGGYIGFTVDISNPEKIVTPKASKIVSKLLKNSTSKKIGIAPFAAYQAKMYPLDLTKKVISEIAKTTTVYLFGGGESEVETLSTIENEIENCISVAGKIQFEDELNLIAQLDCMVAMDSGNAHLAAMQQTTTITLWGATHPFAGFVPFDQPIENCLLPDLKKYPKIPTSIYGNKVVEGYEDAMRTISPESVIEKIQSVLKPNS